MSSHKTDQHHVIHRGRKYHFVSYEARLPNPKTGDAGLPATWFLIRAGKRWPAFPELPDQDPEAIFSAFTTWLDDNVLTATP